MARTPAAAGAAFKKSRRAMSLSMMPLERFETAVPTPTTACGGPHDADLSMPVTREDDRKAANARPSAPDSPATRRARCIMDNIGTYWVLGCPHEARPESDLGCEPEYGVGNGAQESTLSK